jgi:hypothetical protein
VENDEALTTNPAGTSPLPTWPSANLLDLKGAPFVHWIRRRAAPRATDPDIPRVQRHPCWLTPETVLQRLAETMGGADPGRDCTTNGHDSSAVSRRVSAVERRLRGGPLLAGTDD